MAVLTRWLDAPPAGWDALQRDDPNAAPAHRLEVLRAWVELEPNAQVQFVSAERDGVLVGAAPVVLERRLGWVWIRALPYSTSGTALARAGSHADVDRALAEALEAKAREVRAVGGEWVLYRPAGPAVAPDAIERLSGETRVSRSEVIDLGPGAAAAYRRVARHVRESLASSAARGLRFAEEPEAVDETYALYAEQARAWPGHRLKPLALFRRLLVGGAPAGRLFTARDSRGLLSGALVLVGEHEWMVWWSGSHPEARRRQAFAPLLWSIAESAARAGAARLNLGASAGRPAVESFKTALGARAQDVLIRWIGSNYASATGKAVAALQSRLRAGRWRGAKA